MSTRRRCLWRTVCLTEPAVSQWFSLWPDILSAVKAFCVAAHCQRCAAVKHKGFLCRLMTGRLALPTASEDLLAVCLSGLAGWLPLGRPLESIRPCVCRWCFFGNTECLGAGGLAVAPHHSALWSETLFCWCWAGQPHWAVTQTANMRRKQTDAVQCGVQQSVACHLHHVTAGCRRSWKWLTVFMLLYVYSISAAADSATELLSCNTVSPHLASSS